MDQKTNQKGVIIFDFDGVIVDSIPTASNEVRRLHPNITDEQYKSIFHKKPFMDGIETIKHLRIKESEEERLVGRSKYAKEKAKSPLFAGIHDTLQTLGEKYTLTINTNAVEECFTPILDNHNLRTYFSYIAFRENISSKAIRNKNIINHFDVSPEKAIYITDSTGDVVEAYEAGIASIGVTWGAHDRKYFEDVQELGLQSIVDTQAELIEKIDQFFTSPPNT